MVRSVGFVVIYLLVGGPAAADPDPWGSNAPPRAVSSDLRGPEPERGDSQANVTLPSLPTFEVPLGPAGTHSVRELFVAGRALLDTDLAVSGYVTWIYDCPTAIRRRGESDKKVLKRIEDDPTLCERPKFYLGDARDTPPERSLWIIDVPRPFNKLELERITKEDRVANYPDRCESDPKKPRPKFCVSVALGDYVTLKGKFAMSSPHSERNSDGLLVFASIAPATSPPTTTMKAVPALSAKAVAALSPKAVSRPPASEAARKASIAHSNAATKAYGQKDFPGAMAEYRKAIQQWEGNHLAWYGLSGAQIGTNDWPAASASMAKAFELAPQNPMYAMVYGYALYEQNIAEARGVAARRANVPDSAAVQPDLANIDFSRSEQLLRHATKLDDQMWRAHYYLGRIARDAGRARDAADELTKALRGGPSQPGPWIALVELYRRWQYPELALSVAEQAVLRSPDATDVWYVLGMAHDDLRHDDRAITAFSKALALAPSNAKAQFQRGQSYFRSKKLAEAKRDLEAFVKSSSPLAFAKQQANKMLMDIGDKKRR
jgi:tetratricopeptide (TPR) repeat protein